MRCKANVYLHPEVITQNTCSAIEGKNHRMRRVAFSEAMLLIDENLEKSESICCPSLPSHRWCFFHTLLRVCFFKQVGKYHTKIQAYTGEDCRTLLFQIGRKKKVMEQHSQKPMNHFIYAACAKKKKKKGRERNCKVPKDYHDTVSCTVKSVMSGNLKSVLHVIASEKHLLIHVYNII